MSGGSGHAGAREAEAERVDPNSADFDRSPGSSVLRRWTGLDEAASLGERLFLVAALAGAVGSAAAFGINLVIGNPTHQLWLTSSSTVACIAIYAGGRLLGGLRFWNGCFVVVATAVMCVGWMTNQGSGGSTGFWFLVLAVYSVLCFDHIDSVPITATPFLGVVGCLLVEWLRPEWILPYGSARQQFQDVALCLLVVLVMSAVVGPFVARENRRERHRTLQREQQLRTALAEIKVLKEQLAICSHCKKIRDGDGSWRPVDAYISERTNTRFSHGICDECERQHYGYLL